MVGESLAVKFIDILAESAKGRPRRASLNALVRLRRSLRECHDAYGRYTSSAASQGVDPNGDPYGGDHRLYQLHERWVSATHSVLMDIGDLGEELEILSPETIDALKRYGDRESDAVSEAAYSLDVPVDTELMEHRYSSHPPAAIGSFERAMALLDEYIRSEFTADELRAAL